MSEGGFVEPEALGKRPHRTATSENFPVASIFLRPAHRDVILAFYRFARKADDIVDDAGTPKARQRTQIEAMRATLAGESDVDAPAAKLRAALAARGLSPIHGLELLCAFAQDIEKSRYANWQELLDYCRYSAAPVGRFVLDVHGESRDLWPRSDALCTALQIVNHLQDCGEDYRDMDRVYLPLSDLDAAGARVEDLAAERASPALRAALTAIARRTQHLLDEARPFAESIRDRRLALEVAIIQRLAEDLNATLLQRDPLGERVHHGKVRSAAIALATLIAFHFRAREDA